MNYKVMIEAAALHYMSLITPSKQFHYKLNDILWDTHISSTGLLFISNYCSYLPQQGSVRLTPQTAQTPMGMIYIVIPI